MIWNFFNDKKAVGALALISGMIACTPTKGPAGLGALPTVSFSVTPTGAVNTYALAGTTTGGFAYYWDQGTGLGLKAGGANDTVYYQKKGDYQVKVLVTGAGGFDTAVQTITVAADDPGIDLLLGSSLTSADQSNWTVLNTGGPQTTFSFTAQGLNISNAPNSGTNGGIYQAVQVTGGKAYTFNATVSGSGCTNTWVEFYLGTSAPVQGSDYTDNKYNSLNTWSGCGGSAFDGNINSIGCSGNGAGQGGTITFAQSGTVYVMIKAGSSGGSMGTGGVTVSSIALTEPSH
jgi:hypothetical protein